MTLMLTILGCGSSAGVPRPALGWGACDPNNPKNRRRRCSLLIEGSLPTMLSNSRASIPCMNSAPCFIARANIQPPARRTTTVVPVTNAASCRAMRVVNDVMRADIPCPSPS
jgi:hypothetical protein